MTNQGKKWEVLNKGKVETKNIVDILLENRGIKTKKEKEEFFAPTNPKDISWRSLGIKDSTVKKVVERIKKAKKSGEDVIVYGDYDADGICATAIMWEALHALGLNVLPHIPDRFEEGYGINASSVLDLKSKIKNLKLIVTVDNGIVAFDGIDKANELGIDIVVLDHHQKGSKKVATPYILHSTEVCGSGLAWFFSKELGFESGLELAAIGTVADQMPLKGVNRSIVKYGLVELGKTKRLGLKVLFDEAKIENVGTYEVNYIIAPRINAMGRLAKGLDSLRLLCTKRSEKAQELSRLLIKTNSDRQRIVEGVVVHTLENVTDEKVIVIAHESYHEGVIGLAAGKLVEEFYKPSIVISKGLEKSKASARSISGFNIIEAIKKTELILEGGGHPMAAGFSIETVKIEEFTKKINEMSSEILTDELLTRKVKIDLELSFDQLSYDLLESLNQFNPSGLGNPSPLFVTKGGEVKEIKVVGKGANHLKLTLKQGEYFFDAIAFGMGEIYSELKVSTKIDIVYALEDNTWNGSKSLQLKIKDIKVI